MTETKVAKAPGERPLPADDDMGARVARLSPGQLECLRLVDQHHSSKEIAARLNISPDTVNQRMRHALHTLGVERRAQAARIVAECDGSYQRLIHQSPDIDGTPAITHSDAAVGTQIRHADRAGGIGNAGFLTEQRPASSPVLPATAVRHQEQPPE